METLAKKHLLYSQISSTFGNGGTIPFFCFTSMKEYQSTNGNYFFNIVKNNPAIFSPKLVACDIAHTNFDDSVWCLVTVFSEIDRKECGFLLKFPRTTIFFWTPIAFLTQIDFWLSFREEGSRAFLWTHSGGCLGSHIDEERSKLRNVMRFAELVNHRIFERKLRSRVILRACLFECPSNKKNTKYIICFSSD